MSSGQKRVQFNNSERVVSDDHNKLQDAIYQNLAEMMRALLQRSYSPANAPGVSIRETGAYPAQFPGYVLDGLEMVVDIPGWVLITPGTLAGWLTPPTDAARDTGFAIINDVGVSGTGDPFSPDMQIAVNAGSFPRCDIIECSVWVDANQVTASVDVYDPGTELFVPATLPKQYSSQLRYRVRQGTPGVAPVREAGWLILGLAIVQPGATVAQVDFYDCRPLWRAMGEGSDSPDQIVNGAQVNLQSGHFVECSGGCPEPHSLSGISKSSSMGGGRPRSHIAIPRRVPPTWRPSDPWRAWRMVTATRWCGTPRIAPGDPESLRLPGKRWRCAATCRPSGTGTHYRGAFGMSRT